jgi:hypothetical protein
MERRRRNRTCKVKYRQKIRTAKAAFDWQQPDFWGADNNIGNIDSFRDQAGGGIKSTRRPTALQDVLAKMLNR